MKDGSILLLDDDADLRDAVGDLLGLFGARCLALPSVAALQAAEKEVLACKLAILDVNLGDGQPTGIDAYEWLRSRGFAGTFVFLTGHAASHPGVPRAAALRARRLAKRVESADLRELASC